MNPHPRNTPHPWLPYSVVAVGDLNPVLWTVQHPGGQLHDSRFINSRDAEKLALRLKQEASRRAATCS